jgi:hypothetical protein
MATRIQVRRGTNTQWNTTDPILNIGEFGYSTTDSQFKIGDGTTIWSLLDYVPSATSLGSSLGDYIELIEKSAADGVAELDGSKNILAPAGIIFEGTANDFETTLSVTDPTADRTITLPNVTGTVITTGNLSDITNIGVFSSTITMEGSTANDFELTLSAGDPTADRTITFPDETGTVQLRVTDVSDTEIGYLNGVTSAIQTQLDDKSTASKTETFTNKSISLGSNTVTSTLAQLNTAVSDADVASLAGSETLTNKTINATSNTITVTSANVSDFNEAAQDAVGTILSGVFVYNDSTGAIGINNATLTDALLDGVSGSSYGLVGTSQYLDIKTGNGYNKEIELDIAAVKTQLNTDGYITTSSTSTLTNKTLTSPKINEDVAITATATELNYVDGVTSAIQTQIDNKASLSGATFTGAISGTSLTLSGDLTINGTTTTINSTTLTVDDKNIVLADGNTSDASADGGGITLSGATSKTFNWVDATDAWTSSEHMNLLTGKSYKINNTAISAALPALTWGDVKNGKSGLVIS